MLSYIIDGFNLAHRVKALKESSQPHRDLIQYIRSNKLTGSKNNKVIIVFDGKLNLEAMNQKGRYEIIFSGDMSADDIIKNKVKRIKNRSEVIVVSDDRSIRDTIKGLGARECRIADFIRKRSSNRLKGKREDKDQVKNISYIDQKEITDQLRKIWLKE